MQLVRRIEASNETASARLPRDHTSGRVRVALRCRSCLSTGPVGASVNIADLDPSLFVDRQIKEVEKIAADVGATVTPDATALHWIFWCDVGSGPMESSIECTGNVKVPDPAQ